MRRVLIPLVLMLLALPVTASASSQVQVLLSLNASAGELPEGVALAKTGDIFFSVTPLGQIRKLGTDGSVSLLTTLPTGGIGPTGLAVDPTGNVYAADATFNPSTEGVYRIAPDGTATRLPGSGSIQFPNGLAFGPGGDLYVTDSILGAVWRLPRGGGTPEIWVQSPLLAGTGVFGLGFPLGANGIGYRNGELFVTNTEIGSIVRIPVLPDRSAGAPRVVAQGAALFGADGVTVDVAGNLYVAVNPQSTIVRVAPAGAVTTLATAADGLDNPSSLAFGTGSRDHRAIYFVNFALFTPPAIAHPGVLKLDVGIPGAPTL